MNYIKNKKIEILFFYFDKSINLKSFINLKFKIFKNDE
jgi:hypothetical protein